MVVCKGRRGKEGGREGGREGREEGKKRGKRKRRGAEKETGMRGKSLHIRR